MAKQLPPKKKSTVQRNDRRRKNLEKVARAMKSRGAKRFDARGLTPRDAAFVSKKLEGKDNTTAMKEAAAEAGIVVSDRAASLAAAKAMEKGEVISAIESAFIRAGIDDDVIAQTMKNGLSATAYNAGGIEYDDHKTRLQFARTIMQVKKQLGADVQQNTQILNYQSFKDDDGD